MKIRIEKFSLALSRLVREQNRIVYIGLVIFFILFCLWFFVYLAEARRFNRVRSESALIESRIDEILSIARGKNLALAIQGLRVDLTNLRNKLATGDETVIYNLSEAAKKSRLEVRSINRGAKQLLENRIPGYVIEELLVSLNLSGQYKEIGEYLKTLRDDFPILLRVKQLEIKGKGEGQEDLEIGLQVGAYLCRPE